MIERGILFTPENYTKCENGSKVQTRRLKGLDYVNASPDEFELVAQHDGLFHFTRKGTGVGGAVKCPFGTVGDRLYVKEGLEKAELGGVRYRRDMRMTDHCMLDWKWQRPTLSPLHMPKWAGRLWLELTEVRVERLHDISEADAKAEGCAIPDIMWPDSPREAYSYVEMFKLLWESNKIHKPGSWELNPWVWVLSYRKVKS